MSVFRVPRQSLHGPRRKRLDVEYVATQASTGEADSRTAVGRIESSGGVVLPLAYGPPSGGVSASHPVHYLVRSGERLKAFTAFDFRDTEFCFVTFSLGGHLQPAS